MSDVKRWELECSGEMMRQAGAPIPPDGTFVVLASDYDALVAAASELWTYSDHTHTCKVNDTGDHADCDCGYIAAEAACGIIRD